MQNFSLGSALEFHCTECRTQETSFAATMALSPTVEMKSSIWASLPPELIICIIQQTDGDLEAWCEAASGNRLLYREACSRTWASVGIGTEDFMLDPNEYKDEEWSLRPEDERASDPGPDERSGRPRLGRALGWHLRTNRVSPEGKINRATSVRSGIKPATLIRRLYLDLSTEASFGFPNSWSEEYEFPSPSAQTLCYTLACLFPHLEALEQLTVGGPVGEEVMNAIAGLNPGKLRSLIIRTTFWTSHELFMGNRSAYSGIRPLEFSKLAAFKKLRTLRINDLIWGESAELIQLLPNLTSLHEFSVGVRRPQSHEEYGRESPLSSLLCSNAGPRLFTCLPTSLKILQIVDNWHCG